jgi:TonB family protein
MYRCPEEDGHIPRTYQDVANYAARRLNRNPVFGERVHPMRMVSRHLIAVVACICVIADIPFRVVAQVSSDIDGLAARTSKELTKTRPAILLIAPRESCNLAFPICETFDSVLRSDLQQIVPQLRIVGREDAITEVKRNGLLAIDAYDPIALRLVALATNAEAVVTEDLWWEKDGYRLRIDIRNPKTNSQLVPFHTLEIKVPRSIPDTPDNPMLVTDPDTRVSVIVFKGPLPKHFVYPGCDTCPDPRSIGTTGVVQVIGTISAQGKVENVSVVGSPNQSFTKAALDTLQVWRFRPAVGVDGRAFATRQDIEVTFAR